MINFIKISQEAILKLLLLATLALSFSAIAGTKSPSGEEQAKQIFESKLILNSQYKDNSPAKQVQFSKEAEEFARASCESKGLTNCEIIGTTRVSENNQTVYNTQVQADEEVEVKNELQEIENKF